VNDPDNERLVNRIDRKLGMAWSRIGGTLFVLIGLAMLASALGSGDITDHWPLLLGTAVLFALARLAFRSRLGLSELLDDGPPGRKV
jgi:hypothetical protein